MIVRLLVRETPWAESDLATQTNNHKSPLMVWVCVHTAYICGWPVAWMKWRKARIQTKPLDLTQYTKKNCPKTIQCLWCERCVRVGDARRMNQCGKYKDFFFLLLAGQNKLINELCYSLSAIVWQVNKTQSTKRFMKIMKLLIVNEFARIKFDGYMAGAHKKSSTRVRYNEINYMLIICLTPL